MISYRDIVSGLNKLELDPALPVVAHASLSAFGELRGGADTLLGALLRATPRLMMPTFTYKTMLIPEDGPPNNGILYGSGRDQNRMAEFFHMDMPADRLMGIIPETLRKMPGSTRTAHPIMSFCGKNTETILAAQTLAEPLAPLRRLVKMGGWVLLAGVGHTSNTTIHYAEKLAGRQQLTRWALTPHGVVACPNMPGCSEGFDQAESTLDAITRRSTIGNAVIRALPAAKMVELLVELLKDDAGALLCQGSDCERCDAVRESLSHNPQEA
ncbi:MAG: AAC(3) family N-acetyltransferase [Anaerolineae bacterium]|nr:AAC(3) family N-acetyltransferase [Anaerolineae bacterium]